MSNLDDRDWKNRHGSIQEVFDENAKLREELEAQKEKNSILAEELFTVEGALKLSAAKYKQDIGVHQFAAVHAEQLVQHWKQRAEAAESWKREAEKQEPVATIQIHLFKDGTEEITVVSCELEKGLHELFARPIPAPDVAELRAQLEAAQSQVKVLRDALDTKEV